jgi:hypothetical protein
MRNSLCLAITFAILATACQKENTKQTLQITKTTNDSDITPLSIPDVGSSGQGNFDPNYCEGCGNSAVEDYGCYQLENGTLDCGPANGGLEGPICPSANINNALESAEIEYKVSDVIPYMIRDSFLINFPKGQQYITYAYLIGQTMRDYNAIYYTYQLN